MCSGNMLKTKHFYDVGLDSEKDYCEKKVKNIYENTFFGTNHKGLSLGLNICRCIKRRILG